MSRPLAVVCWYYLPVAVMAGATVVLLVFRLTTLAVVTSILATVLARVLELVHRRVVGSTQRHPDLGPFLVAPFLALLGLVVLATWFGLTLHLVVMGWVLGGAAVALLIGIGVYARHLRRVLPEASTASPLPRT